MEQQSELQQKLAKHQQQVPLPLHCQYRRIGAVHVVTDAGVCASLSWYAHAARVQQEDAARPDRTVEGRSQEDTRSLPQAAHPRGVLCCEAHNNVWVVVFCRLVASRAVPPDARRWKQS